MIIKKSGNFANILFRINHNFCLRKQVCYTDFESVKHECQQAIRVWQGLKTRKLLSDERVVSFLVKDYDWNFIPTPKIEEQEQQYDFVINFYFQTADNEDWEDKNCMLVHNQKSREGVGRPHALLNLMNDKPEWKISEDFLAA